MKEIWTLIIKTSLPHSPEAVEGYAQFESSIRAFKNFEDAKKELREKLKEFAFNKNYMFDGEGKLIYLNDYVNDYPDDNEEKDETVLTKTKLEQLQEVLEGIFAGKDEPLTMDEVEYCSDWDIAMDITTESLDLYGAEEGPFNGYTPIISTNMFDMSQEKDYHLYLNDHFGQDSYSELYIDLVKATVE